MSKGNNSWIWWTIGGVTLLGLGVGAYIFFKDRKEKNSQSTTPDVTGGETTYSPPTSAPAAPATSYTPFKNRAEGDAFRAWVNDNYPAYAKEKDLARSSKQFNNSTIGEAWNKYGAEYSNRGNTSQTTASTSPMSLSDIYNAFKDGNAVSGLTQESSNKRVRGLALDGTGFGTNNIYVNVYPDGYIYFEDGTDGQKKAGRWSGTKGNITIEVEGKKETGKGGVAANQLAIALYPNVRFFAFDEEKNMSNLIRNNKNEYVDIQDEIL